MRRGMAVLALALACVLPASSAGAADVVVVPGTSFPAGPSYLSWFGCAGSIAPTVEGPSSAVVRDTAAPMGARAARFAMSGPGHASGPVTSVGSVAGATWSMWVRPATAGGGVAHVWYASADLPAGEVWSGRADLAAAPGRWQQVRPQTSAFAWARVDAATGAVREQLGTSSLAAFTRAHGDGPGFLMAGFGCDGAPFLLDGVTAGGALGVTTYDLEGFAVATSITASDAHVAPGTAVTLSGRTLDGAQQTTGAPLVLEARPAGAAGFAPVAPRPVPGPDADGSVAFTVRPEETTHYRWFQPATGYADAGWSPVVTVEVGG